MNRFKDAVHQFLWSEPSNMAPDSEKQFRRSASNVMCRSRGHHTKRHKSGSVAYTSLACSRLVPEEACSCSSAVVFLLRSSSYAFGEVEPSTIMRWVHRYAPEAEKRVCWYQGYRATSWRMDETYVKVGGKWKYLFRPSIRKAG